MLFWEKRIQLLQCYSESITQSYVLFMSSFFLYPADGVMSANCEVLLIDRAFDLPFAIAFKFRRRKLLEFQIRIQSPEEVSC